MIQKCCQQSNSPNNHCFLQDAAHPTSKVDLVLDKSLEEPDYHQPLTCLILPGLRSPFFLWFLLSQSSKPSWLIYVQKSTCSAIPTFNAIIIIT